MIERAACLKRNDGDGDGDEDDDNFHMRAVN